MLDLLAFPACFVQDDKLVQANASFITVASLASRPLPIPLDNLFNQATSALLRQYQRESHAGKRTGATLQIALKRPGENDWLGFGSLSPLQDDSRRSLLVLQEDYVVETYDALQAYIMQTPDFVMLADAVSASIIYSNRREFLGYTLGEIVASSWLLDYIHPDDVLRVKLFREQMNRYYHREASIQYRLRLKSTTEDGASRYEWIESRENALQVNEAGDYLRLLYQISVITDRKRYEQTIKERNRILTAVQDISRIINQSLDLQIILTELFEHIQDLIPFVSASIFLVEDNKMHLIAQSGLPDRLVARMQDDPVVIDKFTLNIMDGHKPHIVEDTYLEPEWYFLEEAQYIRSWMGVPLFHNYRVFGILNFDHDAPGFYDDSHYDNATMVASHVALAIHNSKLYEAAQNEIRERQQTEAILKTTLIRTDTMYQSGRLMMQGSELHSTTFAEVLKLVTIALEADGALLVTFDLVQGEARHVIAHPEKNEQRIWMDFHRVTGGLNDPNPRMPASDIDLPDGACQTLPDGRYAVAGGVYRRGALIALRQSKPFDSDDAALIAALAGQLTLALERDELDTRLQQYTQHLEVMVAKATSTLQLERQRLQAILDATGEGIIYMEDYGIQYVNPAICRMLGYSAQELVGTNFRDLRHGSATVNQDGVFFDTSDTQPMRRDEYPLICKDGELLHASLTFSLIGRLGASPLRLVAVVRDISNERELRQQQMRFISNAAHELRTPLTSFHLRLHMASRQPERLKEHLDTLQDIYEYMKLLVEELLDLSRFEKGTVELVYQRVNLTALMGEMLNKVAPYAEQSQIILGTTLEADLHAEVDEERAQQLIFILLTNAINYSEAGGTVSIGLKTVAGQDEMDYVRMTFTDEGAGIDASLLPEQVFMPFSRPRLGMRHETGMGLAIAREIVRLHHGYIRVDSVADEGSTFTVLLPLRPPTTSAIDKMLIDVL